MNDSEEYKELKKDERKIYRKITNGVTRKEEEKLRFEIGINF